MTDTPRTDVSQTRFSTPVSDLDDHRHQPESMPRVDAGSPARSRRPTFASVQGLPDRLVPLQYVNDALEANDVTTRDFETAVVDDDLSPQDPHARRGSFAHSPAHARRDTFRRPRDPAIERLTRGRASSTSSRSVSPPNSVDAFAEARPRNRDRANTVNSRPPSELELALQRTVSTDTRRRPTISDERPPEITKADTASTHSSAEEDVCFPVEVDPGKTTRFDYEELEEFVAEAQTKTPISQPLRHKASTRSQLSNAKARIFPDLRPKSSQSNAPKTDADAATLKNNVDPATQEKLAEEGLAHMFNGQKAPLANLNRWTFFSSELDDTIHAAELGGLLMPGERFRDLFELPYDNGVWWLDMVNPTEEEVFAVCKAFGVHPLTREDITIQEPREKVELFHQYYFVCFRSFQQANRQAEDYLEPVNFYAVVFKEGLLTFTFTESPHTLNVRKRISRLRDYINLNSDWICYALIDDIVDSFAPVLRSIEEETDAIEDQVFTARIEDSREILRAVGDCRKMVMQLLRLLGGKADVIKGFAKRCNENYSIAPRGDVGLYLSDIQDHVVTMMSNLGHFEKMLSRSHSNYLAQISVDQVIQGTHSNVTLGKVTVIATILVPLNLICGLFGMNVKVPGQDGSIAWFFGILGVIILFVATCLGVAKKMRYI